MWGQRSTENVIFLTLQTDIKLLSFFNYRIHSNKRRPKGFFFFFFFFVKHGSNKLLSVGSDHAFHVINSNKNIFSFHVIDVLGQVLVLKRSCFFLVFILSVSKYKGPGY